MGRSPSRTRKLWCDERWLELADIEAISTATYIEQLGTKASKPTVKQHLAAIRQLFDHLITGGILGGQPRNLSASTTVCG